ncbi:MAG TPA: DNA polymerase, partial [Blastocatellia bacterium]|nr:DNA polymerase [Blastocatellia bacterium]
MKGPDSPRLFLVDGYALIYRAFFALISRPLTTSKGENTSASWGIANFLQRLITKHQPDYLGWVHDSGLSFRHERYPAYKATREKLTEELQSDFDRGMERIKQMLDAYRIPIMTLPGYEADDVIGTLVARSVEAGVNVVVISGDKDFQQLVKPGVWLLNPGRGGPANVEEHWMGVENADERLGVSPEFVTDYLALVGDSSDNVPGVRGIGDKTALELVKQYGHLESILAHAGDLTKKRPREALLEHADNARLSKELVTIRTDLEVPFDLESLRIKSPDHQRLRDLFIELEFHGLAKDSAVQTPASEEKPKKLVNYTTIDTLELLKQTVTRAREAKIISLDIEAAVDSDSTQVADPLRSSIISISIAVGEGEAYYFPFRHRLSRNGQGELLVDAAGDRSATDAPEDRGLIRGGDEVFPEAPAKKKKTNDDSLSIAGRLLRQKRPTDVRNLPALDSPEMKPLRDLLEDPSVRKTAQNAKFDMLALRSVGVQLAGLDFDTMLASYVLDPGRRSHGLDVLALEFLDHTMTSYADLCGKGRSAIPFEECPVEAARDYSCEDADMTLRLRKVFEPQLESHELTRLLDGVEIPLITVLAEMEWTGIPIDLPWFSSLKQRFQAEREAVEKQIYETAGTEFNINSNPQLREILFDKLNLPILKRTSTGPSTDASV